MFSATLEKSSFCIIPVQLKGELGGVGVGGSNLTYRGGTLDWAPLGGRGTRGVHGLLWECNAKGIERKTHNCMYSAVLLNVIMLDRGGG